MNIRAHDFSGRLTLALFLLTSMNGLGAGTCFNILDYGARNDGSTSSTEAIRSAIRAANAAGGGTVYIPAGDYVTGAIVLTNNLVLEIAAGATGLLPGPEPFFPLNRVS